MEWGIWLVAERQSAYFRPPYFHWQFATRLVRVWAVEGVVGMERVKGRARMREESAVVMCIVVDVGFVGQGDGNNGLES